MRRAGRGSVEVGVKLRVEEEVEVGVEVGEGPEVVVRVELEVLTCSSLAEEQM